MMHDQADTNQYQCRSMADRYEAAARLPPLATGFRDPDSRRPSDAPDASYAKWLAQQRLWELAARIAAAAEQPERTQ